MLAGIGCCMPYRLLHGRSLLSRWAESNINGYQGIVNVNRRLGTYGSNRPIRSDLTLKRSFSSTSSFTPIRCSSTSSNSSTVDAISTGSDDSIFDVRGKIPVSVPVVELKSADCSSTLWELVKTKMIKPYLDLFIETYDLSVTPKDGDQESVIQEIISALKRRNVAVKCSALDPRAEESNDANYRHAYSPISVSLRSRLLGALFVEPIMITNIPRLIPTWKKPIIVSHHVFGDQYRDKGLTLHGGGRVELVFTPNDSKEPPKRCLVADFSEGDNGLCLGMYATESSITSFARCCFRYCILHRLPLYLSVNNPKMATYDGVFQSVFDDIYVKEFKTQFDHLNIWYEPRKFNNMVSEVLRSEGGFLWACKNYDGDVNADLVSAGFGLPGFTTYTYLSQDHQMCIVEGSNIPVRRLSPDDKGSGLIVGNPLSTIFTWTRGLKLRARLDGNARLQQFCYDLESACIDTVEAGVYTRDILPYVDNNHHKVSGVDYLSTEAFLDVVLKTLKVKLVSFQAPQTFSAASNRLSDLW
ncbi:Isocitrate dehydrogenase [NADP] cytoplasmic [Babesia sp. Xinjiang]|uniref:Isocitrate dehydrogenase [NADP] cytoplasmic n=1 Tax=Babesia sp. Xinjiang TaxID=462227 RepID=UPI000A25B8AF|nr:Isocitrate dehydrogenase [NADP] cytoplasmic [Babesia sp. Xinjiang]ORM41894.1 Isocitrate dehydrogenase [NADP] cytoplasmic [Babesia sp. Xinjiang]